MVIYLGGKADRKVDERGVAWAYHVVHKGKIIGGSSGIIDSFPEFTEDLAIYHALGMAFRSGLVDTDTITIRCNVLMPCVMLMGEAPPFTAHEHSRIPLLLEYLEDFNWTLEFIEGANPAITRARKKYNEARKK